MTASTDLRRSRTPPAPLLVLGSVVSVQVGQAVGKQMFGLVDPAGVVTLRLGLAALVLLAIWRPRLPTDARSIGLVVGFGTAIAGMNLIYPALHHLPLGVATALQLLGPLTVALAGSRRVRDAGWAVLACTGVFLLYGPGDGAPLPFAGVLLALASGASMGLYLLLSRRAGAASGTGSTLALAVTWAAIVSLPFGVPAAGADLVAPHVLAAGLGLAILSAVVPYSLDLAALRRLPPRVVGVLESLEPAVGALAGVVLLAEHLAPAQWTAIACITAASAGAVRTRE
ncbi:EamA family transporter [Pseudonocardia nigra]|uniref:EamA family transporter n=1 Tax=Pseudonocardia nigra TaxID=1921578 RepID=UPI001C5F5DE3|nr:EamA family transporter [Pseudonocardia nigra]